MHDANAADLSLSDWSNESRDYRDLWREFAAKVHTCVMDVTSRSESFTAFLLECVSNGDSGSFAYEQRFGEQNVTLSTTLLPPLVRSPLLEVAGPLTCPTVVLTVPVQPRVSENDEESPELKPILDQFSHSLLEDRHRTTQHEAVKQQCFGVQVEEKEIVFVGSKLSRERTFLKQELALHPGPSRTVVKLANLAQVNPMSLDLARAFMSYYLVGARSVKSALPAIWVPCTHTVGAVKEDIVGLGCTHEPRESRLRVYSVREKEVVSGDPGAGIRRESVKYKPADLQGSAFARYNVLSTEAGRSGGSGAEMSVEFSWDDPESFLCLPPTFGTEGVVHIAVEPGSLQATASVFAELQTLLLICEAASEGREWWGELSEGEEVLEQQEEHLFVGRVDDFLKSIDIPLSHTLQVDVVSPTLESTVFQTRENLDFSENLWLFLKDVCTAEDLQATLGAIFKAVLLRKVHNISFRESSNSPLAVLLRELLQCKSDTERQMLAPKFQLLLSPTRSLHCLAQMGIEKLRQDLWVFLAAAKVVSRRDVDGFLEAGEELLEQCHSLCNLFHLVELVGTAKSHHCLPHTSLASLTKSALDYYREKLPFVGFETTPLFSVALPRSSAVLRPTIDMFVGSGSLRSWSVVPTKTPSKMVVMSSVSLTTGCSATGTRGHVYEVTCNEVPTP